MRSVSYLEELCCSNPHVVLVMALILPHGAFAMQALDLFCHLCCGLQSDQKEEHI